MTSSNLHTQGLFSEAFVERLDQLDANIALLGTSLSSICRDAGIARGTPDRWRRELPKTVLLMDDLERAVNARLAVARERGLLPAGDGAEV